MLQILMYYCGVLYIFFDILLLKFLIEDKHQRTKENIGCFMLFLFFTYKSFEVCFAR